MKIKRYVIISANTRSIIDLHLHSPKMRPLKHWYFITDTMRVLTLMPVSTHSNTIYRDLAFRGRSSHTFYR